MSYLPFIGEYGPAGRDEPDALNVSISDGSSLLGAHSNLYRSEFTWEVLGRLIDFSLKLPKFGEDVPQ
jgi:hypothetical protein